MKKVRLKKKKKLCFKLLFLFILFVISLSLTIKKLSKFEIDVNDKEYLDYMINASYKNDNKYSYIVNSILKIFSKIDVKEPTTFLTFNNKKNTSSKIKKVKEEYIKEDIYDSKEYEDKTSYIEVKNEIDNPILYIYNTHQLETYSNEGLSNNMVPNVMMAGSLLKERLNKNNIPTFFEDTNLSSFIEKMGLPENELYGGSRVFISNAKENYKSLKYFIDLHRDSVSKEISTINIDGKNYARVLFVLGTTNKNYLENKKMMAKLDSIISEKYPKLSRGIYEVDIDDWEEIYNQDMDKNVILIELGAKDNTMNEVINGITDFDKVVLGYIPGGSAGDLAFGLGINIDTSELIQRITEGKVLRTSDIGQITYNNISSTYSRLHDDEVKTTRYFDVSAGIGFDAAVCEEALSSRLSGLLCFPPYFLP